MIKLNKGDDDSTKKCKNFGYTFSVIFFLIFLYNLLFLRSFSYYFLALSIFLCILSYVKPNLLKFLSDMGFFDWFTSKKTPNEEDEKLL